MNYKSKYYHFINNNIGEYLKKKYNYLSVKQSVTVQLKLLMR